MTAFSLSMMTMIQGTWLIHSAYLTCSEKTSYLYFSWHVLAVASISIAVFVIMQTKARTQVKKHVAAKHSNLTTTVDTVSCSHNAVDSSLIIPKVLGKSIENLTIDKIVDHKAAGSDRELNSSFESIPTQALSMHSDKCERMSPLEEFNTLRRNFEGVKRSIKVRESSVV